jgi:hypothetical protein
VIDVESASRLLSQRTAELAEVDEQIEKTQAALDKLDALPEVKAPDVLALENARRRLRSLESDRAASVAAVEEARTALAETERERDLATLARLRADAAKRRAALDATLDEIATDYGDPEAAVFSYLARDPSFEKLSAEILVLWECRRHATSLAALSPAERALDLGRWGFILPTDSFVFLAILAKEVKASREARAAEDRERAKDEARRSAPDLGPSYDASGRPYFTPAQAAANPRAEHLIDRARRDPHRALATFDVRMLALVAAQDEEAARSLGAATRENVAQKIGAATINIEREPLVEYDPHDL